MPIYFPSKKVVASSMVHGVAVMAQLPLVFMVSLLFNVSAAFQMGNTPLFCASSFLVGQQGDRSRPAPLNSAKIDVQPHFSLTRPAAAIKRRHGPAGLSGLSGMLAMNVLGRNESPEPEDDENNNQQRRRLGRLSTRDMNVVQLQVLLACTHVWVFLCECICVHALMPCISSPVVVPDH